MRPAARKRLADYLQEVYAISERRAGQLVRISRKALHYQAVRPMRDAALVARLKTLGEQYPRYGYLLLHSLLRAEGLVQNRKRTYRLYTTLGLQVRTRRRKKLVRTRLVMTMPQRPNERWSADIVHDQLGLRSADPDPEHCRRLFAPVYWTARGCLYLRRQDGAVAR